MSITLLPNSTNCCTTKAPAAAKPNGKPTRFLISSSPPVSNCDSSADFFVCSENLEISPTISSRFTSPNPSMVFIYSFKLSKLCVPILFCSSPTDFIPSSSFIILLRIAASSNLILPIVPSAFLFLSESTCALIIS